ncbi:MAG: threonine synthase [Phycisphaerae bacterium]
MSFVSMLRCVRCSAEYPPGGPWTCPQCGPDEGILDVRFDLARAAKSLTPAALRTRSLSHWRYAELLPLDGPPPAGLAHIGWTPLIEAPRLAQALGVGRLRLKDEGRGASGSFKDRPSSLGVALALQAKARAIACASTGNAASSLAHSAAAVGLPAFIFVPRSCPDGKMAQLLAYGACVFRVAGTYDQAYQLCTQACANLGWYNRNCAINPYLVEGKKTGGLELAEQCIDDPPDWVAAGVGDGCSIAGMHKGLTEMRAISFVGWSTRMLGVQAAGCAPIVTAVTTGRLDRSGRGDTYADSINCPLPRNWRKAVRAITDSDGSYVTVTDEQIMEAVRLTGRLSGVFAEPAAAAAVAGIGEAVRRGLLGTKSNVVAMITGNGLKDTAGAMLAVGKPHEVAPNLGQVEQVVTATA